MRKDAGGGSQLIHVALCGGKHFTVLLIFRQGPMRADTFYRWSLAAPVLLPLLVVPFAVVHDAFLFPFVFLAGSVMYIGIVYPLFAGGFLLWSRGKSAQCIRAAGIRLPVMFAPLCGLSMAVLYRRPWNSALFWEDFATGAVLAVVLGYFYVGLVLVVSRRFIPTRVQEET